MTSNICTLSTPSYESLYTTSVTRDLSVLFQGRYSTTFVLDTVIEVTVSQKVPSEANPKVRNHGEGPY